MDISSLPELEQDSMEGIIRPGRLVPSKVMVQLQTGKMQRKLTEIKTTKHVSKRIRSTIRTYMGDFKIRNHTSLNTCSICPCTNGSSIRAGSLPKTNKL